MNKHKVLITVVFVCLAVSASNAAGIIYVDVNSPNDPGTGTFGDPFRKIQDGINSSLTGDTVLIRPGIYSGPGNFDLDPQGKSIIIRSANPEDAEIIANTVIDPNRAGRGFNIHSGEDSNCVIAGLTIRNAGIPDGYNGAGIYCYDNSPTILNCVIKNNHAVDGSGGGICLDYGSATIINCTITGNIADYYGGGIGLRFSSPVIIGCTISGNTAILEGGGIDSGASEPNIINSIISDNNAPLGGGINCYYPGATNVVNCTIVANSAEYAGGAVYCWSQGSAIIKNSILWANSAIDGTQLGLEEQGTASVAYSDVQYGQTAVYDPCSLLVWGEGNIDIDPCFASFNPEGDPNLLDFHLQSSYGRWNSTFYKIDFNQDGIITLFEFARLAGVWMEEGDMPEDLDYSGIVDWTDLELFAQYYLANSIEDGWISDESTSPCIDAGDPNSDWTAEPWPNGERINMGAYGGTNQASKSSSGK
jgi:parallel beta-helix repeat protein